MEPHNFGRGCGGARVLTALAVGLCGALADGQVVQSKLTPIDGDTDDTFGGIVALSPGWALATALRDDDVQTDSGAVYVHERIGDQWMFTQKLKQPNPGLGDQLGISVAASADWLVAGAWQADPGGFQNAGSAHVFARQGSTWSHRQELVASDFDSGLTDRFGETAAMDGGVMLLGMPSDNSKNLDSGSVYVFELQASTWIETAKLAPADPQDWEVGARFGTSVDVSGTTLVIGAPDLGNGQGTYRGAAFVFEWNGSAWAQTQELLPDDPANGNQFGYAIAIDGNTILVGARGHKHTPPPNLEGAVYVFEKQGASWVQTQELAPSDAWNPLLFGNWVDTQGDLAVIAASSDLDLGLGSGSAYAFRRSAGTWSQIGKLLAPDGKSWDAFGSRARIVDTTILVGAFGDDDGCGDLSDCNVGSAYVFELAPNTRQYSSCGISGPCTNHDDHGGCANSPTGVGFYGQGAVLAAGGTTSVAADALRLETRWLPKNVMGILFMGGGQNWLPFGDGLLVVGAGATGIFRFLPPKSSGASGVMSWDGGLVAQSQSFAWLGHIDSGETWYFQTWYRDPIGSCHSGFNTTNGLEVDFTP